MAKTYKVTINDPRYSNEFPVAVNGIIKRIRANEETEVTAAQLGVLQTSGIGFTSDEDIPSGDLSQDTDDHSDHVIMEQVEAPKPAEPSVDLGVVKDDERDRRIAAIDAQISGNRDQTSTSDANAKGTELLDGSIPTISDAIANETDRAYLKRLLAAEDDGKSRSGVLSVINARLDVLGQE